jgi:hypothetical protein
LLKEQFWATVFLNDMDFSEAPSILYTEKKNRKKSRDKFLVLHAWLVEDQSGTKTNHLVLKSPRSHYTCVIFDNKKLKRKDSKIDIVNALIQIQNAPFFREEMQL